MRRVLSEQRIQNIDAAVSVFRRDGMAVVCGLFVAEEIAALQQEASRLWDVYEGLEPSNRRVGLRPGPDGDSVPERLDPVADVSDVFDQLSKGQRLASIAETALGEPVTVMKDKIIYKWPGTAGYGPHRDVSYYFSAGVPGAELVSISVALDDVCHSSGAIEFYPTLRHRDTPSPPQEPRDIARHALDGTVPMIPELKQGDVLLFDGLIPHCSTENTGDRPRRIYTATYAPTRYPDCRKRYYADRWKEHARRQSSTGSR